MFGNPILAGGDEFFLQQLQQMMGRGLGHGGMRGVMGSGPAGLQPATPGLMRQFQNHLYRGGMQQRPGGMDRFQPADRVGGPGMPGIPIGGMHPPDRMLGGGMPGPQGSPMGGFRPADRGGMPGPPPGMMQPGMRPPDQGDRMGQGPMPPPAGLRSPLNAALAPKFSGPMSRPSMQPDTDPTGRSGGPGLYGAGPTNPAMAQTPATFQPGPPGDDEEQRKRKLMELIMAQMGQMPGTVPTAGFQAF